MAQQGLYKINKRPKDEQIENLVIGNFLNKIRDDIDGKFIALKDNMEYQLTELRRQIAQEKQIQSEIEEKIQITNKQRDELKEESVKKTNDLNAINSFYSNKGDNDQFTNLLNSIVARHQALESALKQTNYRGNVQSMNKAWQNEIYKISESIKSAPDASEFAAITDELQKRTQELATIKQISDGKLPCSAMDDLVDKCEERHAGQQGDAMSGYKAPGKIENTDVLQNNERWESCLSNLKDFMVQNESKLQQRNELYLAELKGRVNDLSGFKNVLNTRIPEETDPKFKRKRKEVKSMKNREIRKRNKDLLNNVQKRHNDNENAVKNTMDMTNNKDANEMNNFTGNDGAWRTELDKDTEILIDYMV